MEKSNFVNMAIWLSGQIFIIVDIYYSKFAKDHSYDKVQIRFNNIGARIY